MRLAQLDDLIEALRCLPGVGPKSAQRMAFYLLQRNRAGALHLADCLGSAMHGIVHCQRCRNFADTALCGVCADEARDAQLLCIVEQPTDVLALEKATDYRGRYFVLMGHLSPLDGIGPEDIGLDQLAQRLAAEQGVLTELILATSATVEGETTAHYITQLAKQHGIGVRRLAQGVPLGGELDYLDAGTLSLAFNARTRVD